MFYELERTRLDWRAQYRCDPDAPWCECTLVDVTLTEATVELADAPSSAMVDGQPFFLQIDTIAHDEVGIMMRAVVRHVELREAGAPVVQIEFNAGREEQLLLHLLVRLHALV